MLLVNADYATDKSLAEASIAMMDKLGIRVMLNTLAGNARRRRVRRPAGTTGWCGATTPS